MHRIDFDYAFQPVAAGGLVYFGSSADDTVRAIDAATGKIRWSVTTSGPVRFAPHVYDGKCYAASDDGFVYCLDARTGKTIWKFQATPQDRQMVSDGRMISRWPCRTGVLVLDGVVYVTAGMWPFEGIYIYALDAKSGKVRWVNDTSGSRYMAYPHSGSYALGGVAPQGYLLASEKILLVPTGRSAPAGFDRSTGRFLYYHSANKRNGGSWATIARDIFFNPAHEGAPDLHIELGQSGPRSGDGMLAYSLASGSAQWGIPNRHRIVADDRALYAIGGGKAEAFDFSKETRGKLKWEAQHSRVWSAARSKEALLIGGRGSITAFSTADGRQVWRGETDGEVRGLAIADGRIIAATEKGTIYCFASGKGDSAFSDERKISREEPREETQTSSTDHFIKRIRLANITRGFAIVIGQEDARPAEAIADQTDLHVISVLRDKSKVLAERARLIGRGDVYGSRVVIHHAENPARLPYAQYFANVVVVVGSSGKLSGKELYRILRPCGGLMIFEGIAPESVEKLISQADIPKAERRISDTTLEVVRGKLPGAFDWDSKVTCDHRVRWPLEMLWAGGLGPARMVNRHWKPSTPLAANGRTFVLGEYHIVAVDTYNGTELWSREIGKIFANRTAVSADDQSVYVNFKDHCLELDAQSGKTRKLHGRPALSRHFSLQEPQTFVLEVDDTHSGTIRVSKTDAGIEIVLLTDDPKVTAGDTWNLYFDFRPASKRTAFYGPGAFEGTVVPALPGNPNPASWVKGAGRMHPTPNLKQEPVEGGTKVIFGLEREQLQSFTGTLPKDFTFAATLNSHDGVKDAAAVKTHLFADGGNGVVSQGWGTISLQPKVDEPKSATSAMTYAKLEDLPSYARKPGRLPRRSNTDERLLNRIQPLTAKAGKRIYRKAYGCGGIISSATMDFFRSGTIGFYDLAEDSGLRNFSGVRAGCGVTIIPAAGVVVSIESSAGCSCSYSYQTSFALAPATRRSNEDWAVFYDKPTTGFVVNAALNLGAPGDRRDDSGISWLGFPRPQADMNVPHGNRVDLYVPFSVTTYGGFGPFRTSADRVTITGTDRPWIYTSGVLGIKSGTLQMEYLEPGLASLFSGQPPKIDGRLTEQCWDKAKSISVTDPKATVTLRHDKDNLYVAYHRPAAIDRLGNVTPWKSSLDEDDAAVWEDDSFELYLADSTTQRCLHLGVSASGARYDAVWSYPTLDTDILANITDDAEDDDFINDVDLLESGDLGDGDEADGEDPQYTGKWSSGVRAIDNRAKGESEVPAFTVELRIPWKTLSDAGLDRSKLIVNFKNRGPMRDAPQITGGFERVSIIRRGEDIQPGPFTVRLHFAELHEVKPGTRVFDVKLQGKVVLKDFDVVAAAGGKNRALVREFKGIVAQRGLSVELVPKSLNMTETTAPILSALEIIEGQGD